MFVRSVEAATVFILGSGVLAWIVLGPWMHVREAGLRAMLVGLLVGFNYYRVLEFAAPRFALTAVGRRPRAYFALAFLAGSPVLVLVLIEAVNRIF
jgi:hypothetical protein